MKIERDIIDQFKAWKEAPDRKPILLRGARQIGKTWAMETFGKECFKYCVKFDFDRQHELKSVFQTSKDPERLIKELTLYCDQPIVAGETLLIFDEIQECEEALNSLKYFHEDAPQYHIIAAGSLLGVAVKKRKMTVPVGKVRIINMYPVTFKEFLRASDSHTYEYIEALDGIRHLPEIIMNKLRTEYRRCQPTKRLMPSRSMPATSACFDDWHIFLPPLSQTPSPTTLNLRARWPRMPSCSR